MVPFHTRFRDRALAEMRSATVPDRPGLPAGTYGFLELYCDEPDCDCRRVILQVVSPDSGAKVWATINYGWETAEFYRQWSHADDELHPLHGACLDPLNRQTERAPALLALFRWVLTDESYVARLKRHYELFKQAVRSEASAARRRRTPPQRARRKRRR